MGCFRGALGEHPRGSGRSVPEDVPSEMRSKPDIGGSRGTRKGGALVGGTAFVSAGLDWEALASLPTLPSPYIDRRGRPLNGVRPTGVGKPAAACVDGVGRERPGIGDRGSGIGRGGKAEANADRGEASPVRARGSPRSPVQNQGREARWTTDGAPRTASGGSGGLARRPGRADPRWSGGRSAPRADPAGRQRGSATS